MIQKFSDHAANERTFLAWVRTAIAVMAFGFLIERFDLIVAAMAPRLKPESLNTPNSGFANAAGFAFILLGVAMIGVAAIRFFRIAKEIERDEAVRSSGSLFDLVLASLLSLLGLSLLLYLSRVFLPLF